MDLGYLPTTFALFIGIGFGSVMLIVAGIYLTVLGYNAYIAWSPTFITAVVIICKSILVNDVRVMRSVQAYEPVKVNFEVSLKEYVQLIKRENKNP